VDVAGHQALGGDAGGLAFFRSSSSALAKSPPVSASAFLQSIIPALVFSRSSFTAAALTVPLVPSFFSATTFSFQLCFTS
jgi:hypothetical protein